MTDTPYTKHTTHTDALDTLGSVIGPDDKRDAIHIAVEPVICGSDPLSPGNHVVLDILTNMAYFAIPGTGVGIVDPFLTRTIEPGERFWLLVYPREITSLRHVWEHPQFAPSTDLIVSDPLVVVPPGEDKAEAERWLRDYILDATGVGADDDGDYGDTFDTLIAKAARLDDDYLIVTGHDAYGTIPDAFWWHLSIYLGEPVGPPPGVDEVRFSCSC